ncbi:hypothetical protein [Marispirochaeta aestuarii]|uniref:hypothetical protein n=1 Tax=Marispirochaeta aestuarii TaxID=1963862 RepID=UPI0029C99FAA|nr:hypothetical protein [Marispirochaeta aestuarii]
MKNLKSSNFLTLSENRKHINLYPENNSQGKASAQNADPCFFGAKNAQKTLKNSVFTAKIHAFERFLKKLLTREKAVFSGVLPWEHSATDSRYGWDINTISLHGKEMRMETMVFHSQKNLLLNACVVPVVLYKTLGNAKKRASKLEKVGKAVYRTLRNIEKMGVREK